MPAISKCVRVKDCGKAGERHMAVRPKAGSRVKQRAVQVEAQDVATWRDPTAGACPQKQSARELNHAGKRVVTTW